MVALWKNRYDVMTLPSVLPFGRNLEVYGMLNQIQKQQILLYKNLAVYNAFRSTVTLRRCAAQVISSFVIFAVLDLRDGGCRP